MNVIFYSPMPHGITFWNLVYPLQLKNSNFISKRLPLQWNTYYAHRITKRIIHMCWFVGFLGRWFFSWLVGFDSPLDNGGNCVFVITTGIWIERCARVNRHYAVHELGMAVWVAYLIQYRTVCDTDLRIYHTTTNPIGSLEEWNTNANPTRSKQHHVLNSSSNLGISECLSNTLPTN